MRIYNLVTRYLCVNSALHHLRPIAGTETILQSKSLERFL